MGILAECPKCHRKRSVKRKKCDCGHNLDKAKKARKLRYWIDYKKSDGKWARESIGKFADLDAYSIRDAQKALSQRTVQVIEKPSMFNRPQDRTFSELVDWHLNRKAVKALKYSPESELKHLKEMFGFRSVSSITKSDLENYQNQRLEAGKAPATIDKEIRVAKTMITAAFYDNLISGDVLKPFSALKKLLKKGANARKQTVSVEQYKKLIEVAPAHLRTAIVIAFNTGMRLGEIRNLRWAQIDSDFIRLTDADDKEKHEKSIPINQHVRELLKATPRVLRSPYVINFKGLPITGRNGFKRSFVTACKKAEIPQGRKTDGGITFHDFRRSFKTNLLKAGVDKRVRDAIVGHNAQDMDRHYIVVSDDMKRTAVEQFTNYLDVQIAQLSENRQVGQEMVKIS